MATENLLTNNVIAENDPANTGGPIPVKEFNVTTNEQSDWQIEFQNDLNPGMHTVVVTDESGQETEMALFVVKDQPTDSETPVPKIILPGFFQFLIWFFIAAVVIFCTISWFQAKRAREKEKGKSLYYKIISVFCGIIAVLILLLGSFFALQSNIFSNFGNQLLVKKPVLVDVTGKLIDPWTDYTIQGISLIQGNHIITTPATGVFAFSQIEKDSYVQIIGPNLKQIFLKFIGSGGTRNIYYNPEMYNLLINIKEFEAKADFAALYDLAPQVIKNMISKEEYGKSYEPLFSHKNRFGQQMIIRNIQVLKEWVFEKYQTKFDKIVQVEMQEEMGSGVGIYFMVNENGAWHIFK